MFTLNDKEYEIKLTLQRVANIEKAIGGEAFNHALLANDGVMSLTVIMAVFAYGVIEVGANATVAPQLGRQICEQYLNENGYVSAVNLIHEAAIRDVGFLFRAV
jgi:hypothetical protein